MKKFSFRGMKLPVKEQVAGEHLMNLYDENDKKLTAEIVIEDATAKSSPLHPCFEWNNKKAAHSYRLEQARHIIKNVTIVREEGEEKLQIKNFVSIRTDEDGQLTHSKMGKGRSFYVTISDVMSNHDLKEYTFEQAYRELMSFRSKYDNLRQFEKLFELIDSDYA